MEPPAKRSIDQHKKQCERRVAELHDGMLFKEPPLNTEIVLYASFGYRLCVVDEDSMSAAGKSFVLDAFTHPYMIIKATNSQNKMSLL